MPDNRKDLFTPILNSEAPNPESFSLSRTAQQISPFHVMQLLGQAKQLEKEGRSILHLEIGEPDFPSLDAVHHAVQEAMSEGLTHYTPSLGLPELREKLSNDYAHRFNATVDPNQILLSPGSSSALQLTLTAILNPGDEVIMADPTYPCNRTFVELLHGRVVSIPVGADTAFQLTLAQVFEHWTPNTRAIMVASPSNPTGTLCPTDTLVELAKFASERHAWLIVDEIYQGLVYDQPASTLLAQRDLPDNVFIINSFSKYFGMTGWRLGWLVAPKPCLPTLERLAQNLYLAAPTPAQYGALRALDDDVLALLEERKAVFAKRRNTLYTAMSEAGFHVPVKPQGAFYLYWDVSAYEIPSFELAQTLLDETGVTVTPGIDFGEHNAHNYIRLAFTTEENRLQEAVLRLQTWFEGVSINTTPT